MSSIKRMDKIITQAEKYVGFITNPLPDEILRLKEECEKSFYTFIKTFWSYAGSDQPYMDNWHVGAIAEHLQACFTGQIKYLIINVPPGLGKSILASTMFPAYCWSVDPIKRFIYPSYAEKLSVRDNRNCQMLLTSELYRKMWGDKFSLNVQQATSIHNSKGGYRLSCGFTGTITGHRVWAIISDDPNSIVDVKSETIRDETNRIWDAVLSSRLNNMSTGVKIVIQQRSNFQDLSGWILAKELPDVVHLRLPMEFEISNRCKTIILPGQDRKWQDPRKKDGELLFPDLFNKKASERQKLNMSAYDWSGQYQQSPTPAGGGILRKEWFQWWQEKEPPECEFILQSYDTALTTSSTSAYSACTTWGVFRDQFNVPNVILLDLWRDRVEYPELRHMAQRMAKNYHDTIVDSPLSYEDPPDLILIEEKVSGFSLIQDLRRGGIDVVPFKPRRKGHADSSKEMRARLASSIIEAGRVWLPAKPPHYETLYRYANTFVEACIAFPMDDDSKDIVDTMSQALLYLMERSFVNHPEDGVEIPVQDPYIEKRPLY